MADAAATDIVQFNARIPASQHGEFRFLARRWGLSVQDAARQALEQWMERARMAELEASLVVAESLLEHDQEEVGVR